jgi:hypothetical protein
MAQSNVAIESPYYCWWRLLEDMEIPTRSEQGEVQNDPIWREKQQTQ